MWAQTLVAPGRFEKSNVQAPGQSDVPVGHVLLRSIVGGICGSDLPTFRGRSHRHPDDRGGWASNVPGVPLHEVVGEVVASEHPARSVGDLVVGWASQFDSIAEFVVSDGNGLIAYDPSFTPVEAITIQPLACVIGAVERLDLAPGVRAAVLGQGPIGLLFSRVLNDAGAEVIGVDRVDRADAAALFGVSETVTAMTDRWSASLDLSARPPVIVEAIGHQVGTLSDAITAVAPSGQIFYFGVPDDPIYPISMQLMFRKNLTLRSGATSDRTRLLELANTYLLAHPDLRTGYVSDVFGADESQPAFEAAIAPKPGQFKIALDMAR